ncbi:MAG: PEP-CTERM sorting domain-containing protein [Alteromonadaceae bacterium]|nr:PEP-CTERM sorting domain-containing protein [Alteromonadaceae bacterium]
MKISKIASVTTLVLASAITAPAMATNYSGGWHSGCGNGGNTGDGCNAADYFADDLMYSLASDGISNAVVDGVTINASAYSDTAASTKYTSGNYVYKDENVEAATLQNYGDGYGVINADEGTSSPAHSADNQEIIKSSWWSSTKYVETDFDYVLISFDEEVNVTGATFSWLWKETDTQVSVAALSDTSMLTSGVNTWGDIAGDALAVGSFDVLNCDDTDLAEISGLDNVYSQYWIIGAYNTVFGDIGYDMFDDGFKLASVGFNKKPGEEPPTTQVTEPGTFAMLFMGGALAMWRRRRSA